MYEFDVVRDILDVGEAHGDKVVVLVLVEEVFRESKAYALGYASVLLSVDYEVVVDDSHVSDKDKLFTAGLACFRVDRDHGKVDREHVEAEGFAQTGVFVVAGADFKFALFVDDLCLGVALVEDGDVLGDHLIVCPVGAVGLAHCVEKLFCSCQDGVAHHYLGTARRGSSAVGGLRGVAEDQLDLLGPEVQRLKGFMRGAEASDVSSLTVVFPCVVDDDSVLGELYVAGRFVRSVVVGVVYAHGSNRT